MSVTNSVGMGKVTSTMLERMKRTMVILLVFLICFFASVVGAICGIGGGVIIKPALDAFGIMGVSTISFLSGCTVLSMTTYSVVRSRLSGSSAFDKKTGLPMAIGAAVGGVVGTQLFQVVKAMSTDPDRVGAVQAACLLGVTLGTLVYTLFKSRIPTHHVTNSGLCLTIGGVLGIMSSFLGIGGGPINLVLLFYFFSMGTKAAAETSLYIIFFSQLASLIASILTHSVPPFSVGMLCLMVGGGIAGGICGRSVNKKLDSRAVDKLFIALMVVLILVNLYNIYRFL